MARLIADVGLRKMISTLRATSRTSGARLKRWAIALAVAIFVMLYLLQTNSATPRNSRDGKGSKNPNAEPVPAITDLRSNLTGSDESNQTASNTNSASQPEQPRVPSDEEIYLMTSGILHVSDIKSRILTEDQAATLGEVGYKYRGLLNSALASHAQIENITDTEISLRTALPKEQSEQLRQAFYAELNARLGGEVMTNLLKTQEGKRSDWIDMKMDDWGGVESVFVMPRSPNPSPNEIVHFLRSTPGAAGSITSMPRREFDVIYGSFLSEIKR